MVNTQQRQELMRKIQICDFVLNDVALYLDTHPDDQAALAYYQQYQQYRIHFAGEYTAQYGPLTHADYHVGPRWNWVDQPWPWQLEEA